MRTISVSEFNERRKKGEVLSKEGKEIERPLDYLKTKRKKGVGVEAPKVDPNAKIVEAIEKVKQDSGAQSEAIVGVISDLIEQIRSIKEADPEKRFSVWNFDIERDEKTLLMTKVRARAIE